MEADGIHIPAMDEAFALSSSGIEPQVGRARRIAPDLAAKADWHNARAALLMALNQRLEEASDDRTREAIIVGLATKLMPEGAKSACAA